MGLEEQSAQADVTTSQDSADTLKVCVRYPKLQLYLFALFLDLCSSLVTLQALSSVAVF